MRLICATSVLMLFAAGVCAAQQSSCVTALAPLEASVPGQGGPGTISVTAPAGCAWTAAAEASWIIILGVSAEGVVSYHVTANPTLTPRTGTITVGHLSVVVKQAAATCSYILSPSAAALPATGGKGSFTLTTLPACPWTAASNSEWWLTVSPASGTGSATLTYTAAPNAGDTSRSAIITAGYQFLTVTQAGTCTFALTPARVYVPGKGATGTVTATASGATCPRNVVSQADWIAVPSDASGKGSGTFTYTAASNMTGIPRSGTVAVTDQVFTITQDSGTCTMTMTTSSVLMPSSGGTGAITITGGCAWFAVSQNDWITITSAFNGMGDASITYKVGPNSSLTARVGYISVNGQFYAVNQSGATCSVMVDRATIRMAPEGGSSGIPVTAVPDCRWAAASNADWITLGNASGTGEATVTFTVTANNTGADRSGSITIADQTVLIFQPTIGCTWALSATSASMPASGGVGAVNVTGNCSWLTSSQAPWITVTPPGGLGNGIVSYSVAPNPAAEPRTGTFIAAGITFTVTQAGGSCEVALNPASAQIPGNGGAGAVNVTSGAGCRWTASSQTDWLQITSWSNVSGAGAVNYAAGPNPAWVPRAGTLLIGGKTFTVTQGAAEVLISDGGVVNAASSAAGPVAPGEIITIYGSRLGPAIPVSAQLTADGKAVTTALGDTLVTFDYVPAPLLYVSEKQVTAIVPYGVAGKSATQLQVAYQGHISKAVTMRVAGASPGLFTADSSGAGPGAILNQDGRANSATNPAAKGSVVMLFATGAGQTVPKGVDGQLAAGTLPKPELPVTVLMSGIEAEVTYAGAAPGMVAGVLQVNARVPARAASGNDIPVLLRVGSYDSQTRVTLAVR